MSYVLILWLFFRTTTMHSVTCQNVNENSIKHVCVMAI